MIDHVLVLPTPRALLPPYSVEDPVAELRTAARDAVDGLLRKHPERLFVVAPDLGAVKLARSYAGLLDLPMAIVHKTRVSGREVTVEQVVGDVRGRSPIVVDDMLSTGATIEAALKAAFAAGAQSPSTVVVSHGLFVGRADEILAPMGIQRVFTTDTVMPRQNRLPVDICTLAPMLAEAIRRLHANESLEDLNSAVCQPR